MPYCRLRAPVTGQSPIGQGMVQAPIGPAIPSVEKPGMGGEKFCLVTIPGR